MTRVLLLLDQKENQQLLSDELSRSHQVTIGRVDGDLEQEFDLCVVDGRSLDRLWEKVVARKTREQPIFLPVLLVTARPGVKLITRDLWRSVDELIITPIERGELRARIEILLRARALSLALRQRAEDAERAAHTRDDVLAIVSHDLRNPLNLVLTCSDFLLDAAAGLAPRHREQLQMIRRAAGQMNRLIQDLLEVSSMEAGNVSVELRPVAAPPLVAEACRVQEHAAALRGVELTSDCEVDLPPVLADQDRIQQVLGNLIGNGIKYTPAGGRVMVRAERVPGAIRISVEDTGPGIAEEDLAHVFDRFWQAARSRQGGAGLGLSISRGIVSAHGGEISVESEVGRGSVFAFTLRRADGATDEAPKTEQG